jgi:hypothetical protein
MKPGDVVLLQLRRSCWQLPFVASECVHVVDKLHVAGALLDVSPFEHAGLSGDHHFRRRLGHLAERSGVVRKAGNIGGDIAVDHRADADGLARKNAGVDGCFGIIADHAA